MTTPLDTLEPKQIWSHFAAISAIPRPSKHEERITQHLVDWANERNHEVRQDDAGSLCIRVAATPGHENADPVILQGHMDMVCEKNSDVEHDFMTQGINLAVDGDWVVGSRNDPRGGQRHRPCGRPGRG